MTAVLASLVLWTVLAVLVGMLIGSMIRAADEAEFRPVQPTEECLTPSEAERRIERSWSL